MKNILILLFMLSLFSPSYGSDEFDAEFSSPKEDKRYDPLMGYNRVMTDFNDFFYTNVLFPVVRGYRYVAPQELRESIERALENVQFPIRFANNILQLKFSNSLEELARFCINSTIGFAGLFDHAESSFGLKAHNEDFGQTLGYYGIGGGFHLVLPILGPSNLRDSLSKFPDTYLDPLSYMSYREANMLNSDEQGYGAMGFKTLNSISFYIDKYELIKKDSLDFYIMLREVYEQNRQKEIDR